MGAAGALIPCLAWHGAKSQQGPWRKFCRPGHQRAPHTFPLDPSDGTPAVLPSLMTQDFRDLDC